MKLRFSFQIEQERKTNSCKGKQLETGRFEKIMKNEKKR